ncbi:unnamed protein product [Spirodela intermedia]|uniref:Uncharacterized protein n=1 Tax=Spirodela intermedia TaxID=51605 RepID=A0A7I8JMN1_SPIIN|nr:unnamed protein product [Spirodela intermedia]CAA6671389.1 unnamed protein product [Spirodela intermedia]
MENAGMAENSHGKRVRDGSEESPTGKKLRQADLEFLEILEDMEAVDRSASTPADSDLADVMRSLEEEIAASSPSACEPQQQPAVESASSASTPEREDSRHSDLGYLLEASDDELGSHRAEEDPREDANQESAAPGQIWGFTDEIPNSYDALDLEAFENSFWPAGANEVVVFDGGLFDYPDVGSFMPSDLSEFSWQPETTPAV